MTERRRSENVTSKFLSDWNKRDQARVQKDYDNRDKIWFPPRKGKQRKVSSDFEQGKYRPR